MAGLRSDQMGMKPPTLPLDEAQSSLSFFISSVCQPIRGRGRTWSLILRHLPHPEPTPVRGRGTWDPLQTLDQSSQELLGNLQSPAPPSLTADPSRATLRRRRLPGRPMRFSTLCAGGWGLKVKGQSTTDSSAGRNLELLLLPYWRQKSCSTPAAGVCRPLRNTPFPWKQSIGAASGVWPRPPSPASGNTCNMRECRCSTCTWSTRTRTHTHAHTLYDTTNKKRREESVKTRRRPDMLSPPPQVQRGPRIPEGGGATDGDALQVRELRLKASSYRRRAWGGNFDRDHLSQLLSEHNALWEPTDTTAPPTPRLSPARGASKGASVTSSTDRNTPAPAGQDATVEEDEGQEQEEDEQVFDEEGRLPTPRLHMRPVQRTHHDLTTPATGGAILVGKLKSNDEASPNKPRCGSAVSSADKPVKLKEAWSDDCPAQAHTGPSPNHKQAAGPASKPIRTKQTAPMAPPPPHCIQGTLRNADFQHNGELGLRFRELRCPAGGCCSDEADRLSVMTWRSEASVVLQRAQRRREHFWGKR
ncbi:nuclear protein MDM1 isoform 2-T2 [Spinachia spinachia]